MPSIGNRCHELRSNDKQSTWRIMYHIDEDAVIILEVFQKKSNQTPGHIIDTCQQRLKKYDLVMGD
jgi:phage-related protein